MMHYVLSVSARLWHVVSKYIILNHAATATAQTVAPLAMQMARFLPTAISEPKRILGVEESSIPKILFSYYDVCCRFWA